MGTGPQREDLARPHGSSDFPLQPHAEPVNQRQHLSEWRDFLRSEIHVLVRCPELLFQTAANLGGRVAPAEKAWRRWSEGHERRPWIRRFGAERVPSRCLLVLSGHGDRVDGCSFSPDGSHLATTSADGTVRTWDLETGRQALELETDPEAEWPPLYLTADRLLIPGPDHSLRVHDARSGRRLLKLDGHESAVTAVAVSPDERRLVSGSCEGTLRLWDLGAGRPGPVSREHDNWISVCRFSSDGTRFATNSWDGTARLWDAGRGTTIAVLDGSGEDLPQTLAFTPDGRRLIVASGPFLSAHDAEDGREIARVRVRETGAAAFVPTPSGDRVVSVCGGLFRTWDAESLEPLETLGHHPSGEMPTGLAVSPDGRLLASAGHEADAGLRELDSPGSAVTLIGHSGTVRGLAFSPDSRRLATASWDRTIRVWDTRAALGAGGSDVVDVFFTPGTRVATVARRRTLTGVDRTKGYARTEENPVLEVRDARTGESIERAEGPWGWNASRGWRLAPDASAVLFPAPDDASFVIDLDPGEPPTLLPVRDVEAFDVSSDRFLVLTAGNESRVSGGMRGWESRLRIWDRQGRERQAWPVPREHGVSWCAFAAGNRRVLTAGSREPGFRLWRRDGEVLGEIPAVGPVPRRPLSRDRSRLVVRGEDNALTVWDAERGVRVATLAGHAGPALDWVVSPDGAYVVSTSADRTVRLWDAAEGREKARFRLPAAIEVPVRLSPDGARLLLLPESERTRGDHHDTERIELQVWDVRTGLEIGRIHLAGDASTADWATDGDRFAAVTYSGLLYLLGLEGAPNPLPLWG